MQSGGKGLAGGAWGGGADVGGGGVGVVVDSDGGGKLAMQEGGKRAM